MLYVVVGFMFSVFTEQKVYSPNISTVSSTVIISGYIIKYTMKIVLFILSIQVQSLFLDVFRIPES